MVTRSPRDFSRLPNEEAVSPLPSDEATPPVTKTCLVGCDAAKWAPVGGVFVLVLVLGGASVWAIGRTSTVHGVLAYQPPHGTAQLRRAVAVSSWCWHPASPRRRRRRTRSGRSCPWPAPTAPAP